MNDATQAKKILVVDDHDLVRSLVVTILERGGFEVLAASSGSEALPLYESHMAQIGCVLLDLSMPQMSGPQVLNALRKMNDQVKVVLMSAHDEATGTDLIRDAGAVGYLRKPFKPDALTKIVADVLATDDSPPA